MSLFLCLLFVSNLFRISYGQVVSDRNALLEFYNSITQPSDLVWSTGSNLCLEEEIQCDANEQVTKIIILNKNLHVSIPSSFGNFKVINTIIISNSAVTGQIPKELSSLNFLKILDLSENNISGSIPIELMFLSATTLYLNNNQLSGNIPENIFSANLEIIHFQNNFLQGSIPKAIKNSFKLIDLDLSNNSLSERIPAELGTILSLDSIKLNKNQFIGSISHSLRTKSMSTKFFDENHLDCPAPFYQGTNEDDRNSYVNRCNNVGCSSCQESCRIQGLNYDTKICLPLVPCTTELSQYAGIPGDDIFLYGYNYFPGSKIICRFGTRVSGGKFVNNNIIECPATVSQISQNVSVTVTIDGVVDACGTIFKFSSGSGVLDPHFSGFHGEKMEVKRDIYAANQLFHLFCSPSISVTALFYEYNDGLLFMTKFWVRLGSTEFTLHLSTSPKILKNGIRSGASNTKDEIINLTDLGRKRVMIEDGHLEWDDNMLRARYGYLNIVFSNKIYLNNSPYMNIDFYVVDTPPKEERATGIIGRTLKNKKLSQNQFQEYLQFKASVNDVIQFSCPSLSFDTL